MAHGYFLSLYSGNLSRLLSSTTYHQHKNICHLLSFYVLGAVLAPLLCYLTYSSQEPHEAYDPCITDDECEVSSYVLVHGHLAGK